MPQAPRLVAPDEAAQALGLRPHALTVSQRWLLSQSADWTRLVAAAQASLPSGEAWVPTGPDGRNLRWRSVTLATEGVEVALSWLHEVWRAHALCTRHAQLTLAPSDLDACDAEQDTAVADHVCDALDQLLPRPASI